MAVTFKPKHKYFVWPDDSGKNGHEINADSVEVTPGGALVFSTLGSDNATYVTEVRSPNGYHHFNWYGDQ